MDDVFMQFWQTQRDSSAHEEVVTRIFPMGTAEMDLQDGAVLFDAPQIPAGIQ